MDSNALYIKLAIKLSGISILAIIATGSVAQTALGIVSGEVKSIQQDGILEIDSGESIKIWGLNLVNLQLSSDLLIGNSIVCSIIGVDGNIFLSDCDVKPKKSGLVNDVYDLDLFIWLYEFSLAAQECSSIEIEFSGTNHANGTQYFCTLESGPQRFSGNIRIE